MRTSLPPRDSRGRETSSPLTVPGRSGGQSLLPPLHDAIPEIRSTNPRSRDYSDYPRELHHNPPGPSRYPTAPSLGPSPPNHRSRFPVNDNSSSSHRSTNGHGSGYYDRSRTQPEVHLPMHSGPPSRNNGSDSRNGGPSNPAPRVQTPEQTGRGSLPPIYTLTQATVPTVPSHLPPMNSNGRRSLGNPYPQPLTPPPPHTDSRYHYNGYAPHPHNSHVSMERPVEFQNVEAGEKSKSKRRGNLPKQTTDILRAWLHEHLDHAYPNEEEKQQLIRETGLTDKQVSNWFINARRRNVPRLLTQAEQEQEFKNRASSSVSPPDNRSPGRR